MRHDETELEMTRRHVAEGGALVERQRQTLAELRQDGHPTDVAEQLLVLLESTQSMHEQHLARLIGHGVF
jgi:hypothetical protein